MTPQPQSRDEALERSVATSKIIGSPGFPFDEQKVRDRAGKAYDRMFYPPGVVRQMVAIYAQDDRTEALGSVTAPALVIHGAADPLVNLSGGEATAKAIPGADLLIVEGMGHDLPQGAWPQIIDAITDNAKKAGAK
jgi:pimeloyl-ACP methyl ester carboxylesterase